MLVQKKMDLGRKYCSECVENCIIEQILKFILPLQGEVKDEDFRNYFEQFGEIDDCVVGLITFSWILTA